LLQLFKYNIPVLFHELTPNTKNAKKETRKGILGILIHVF